MLQPGSNQGRPDLFVGNTPGTDGGIFANPRRVVNQTIGASTNHSIPQATVARRFTDGSDAYIKKGQFLFAYRPTNTPMGDSKHILEMQNLLNLPMANYWLARLSLPRSGAAPVLQGKSAAAVADLMTPHGVVLNTQGGVDDGAHQERVLNCTIRGFADTFNLWGHSCHDGTPLYFVYRKRPLEGVAHHTIDYTLHFNGKTSPVRAESKQYVWQIFPHAGGNPPPLEATEWEEDGTTHYGFSKYIGRVNYGRWVQGISNPLELMTNVNRMVNQPQCTVFVDL